MGFVLPSCLPAGRHIMPLPTGWQMHGHWQAPTLLLSCVATRKTWMQTERWLSSRRRASLRRTVPAVKSLSSVFVLCFFLFPRSPFCPVYTELMFLETSALTGENVEEGFLKCARTILNKIDSGTALLFVNEACQSLQTLACFYLWSLCMSASVVYVVWHMSLRLVSKASWTRRGWVQVFSMETLRWGSCDSREAPPHRISSSVIARGWGPRPHLSPRPKQAGRPLQVSVINCGCNSGTTCDIVDNMDQNMSVTLLLFSFGLPHFRSRCFWVCGTLLPAVSHTLDHLEEW